MGDWNWWRISVKLERPSMAWILVGVALPERDDENLVKTTCQEQLPSRPQRVYEEKSGKKIIAGTFNGLLIGKLPQTQNDIGTRNIVGGTDSGCPSLYISITDLVDGTELRLDVSNVSKNMVLFSINFKIQQSDRLATVEIIAPLPPFGSYTRESEVFSFDHIWQGEILGSHRLMVKEIELPTQQEEGEK